MNCTMQKKEGINLEVVQLEPKREKYSDLLDLTNYQILCRRCNDHRHMLQKPDCRPNDWHSRIPPIPNFLVFSDQGLYPISLDLEELRREMKAIGIDVNLNDSELLKEIKLSKLISTYHHGFISNAAKDDNFIGRDGKYSSYLKMLNMDFEKLKQWQSYSQDIISKVYDLQKHSIREYLVRHYGRLSKTSIIYAMAKEEYRNASFLNAW